MSIPTPLVLDMQELTLGELAELGELLGASLTDLMSGPRQAAAIAAIAWLTARRLDPSFTYEDAKALRMADLDIRGEATDGPKGENGNAPQSSLASGT